MLRLAVLVSGRGTNLQALLDHQSSDYEVSLVCSNRAGAPALERARRAGVPAFVFEGRPAQVEMARAIREARADLIVLAGFDRLLSAEFFATLDNAAPLVSTHPSLLPKYGGPGMIGRRVHEAVLAAGDLETGCTVFRTRPDRIDEGEILAQTRVPVVAGDTPETLEARVLEAEHETLVRTVRRLSHE
ncbi:MAG TPA: phosphoribosylglycinamide formyltransferase [Candidatus Dormibacteraeota bacterium]|nr:phosphoribosylglycinamide formyltransferase [Candidatus Dormibacteraeota bacterium]